jgi:hypothetical protein
MMKEMDAKMDTSKAKADPIQEEMLAKCEKKLNLSGRN